MAKRIQLSSDDSTWYTLPGNSGELRNEAGELVDTIFGQDFESSETGLITGTIATNALYKGFAGYVVKLEKSGVSTPLTNEAMSQVGSTKTYVITDAAKQALNPSVAIVVNDNAIDKTSEVLSINFLMGEVTFKSTYTPSGPITLTGEYFPLTEIGGARTFTLSQTAASLDNTDIPTARANGGFRTFDRGGLKSVSLEIGGVYKLSNAFRAALIARDEIIVSINPDNNNLSVARGLFKYMSESQSGDVGALEEETLALRLSVPEDPEGIAWTAPFAWRHSALSKLSPAIKAALESWQNNSALYAKYLHDGTNGLKSEVVITDLSLSGGLESMNEFTVNLQMSGAATPVP